MVIFKSIAFKNLLSFGNTTTTVSFDKGNTLVTGENGNGKSAILDALFFALFGKSMRKGKNGALINRRNKRDLYVECIFEVNGKEYTIKRGLSPKIFKIFINASEMDSNASVHDTQGFIERIIGMNQDSFRQIVVLGITDFTPFMKLNPNQRRTVVEQILDIEIFGELNKLLKTDYADIRKKIVNQDHKIDLTKNSMEVNLRHLKELEINADSEILSNIAKCETQIAELGTNTDFLHNELSTANMDNNIDINELTNVHQKTTIKKQNLTKNINNLRNINAQCPTCFNDIDDQYKHNLISEHNAEINLLDDNLSKMKDMIEVIKIEHNRIKHIQNNIDKNNANVKTLITQIKVLTSHSSTQDNTVNIVKEIDKLREDLILLENKKRALLSEKESINVLDSMLCDTGVKRHIIKKYLPYLNQQINKYLQVFDFPIKFELDELFNEEVLLNGRETDGYRGFSEGEKLRIDLSILFSLRDLAKEKNCVSTNLLVFDEMDFSLDYNGLRSFLDIILGSDRDLSIMMISHKNEMKDEFREEFDNSILVEKGKNGFSTLEII
jgi:DNA repair exonuclease SbcCD ATPase subunit